MKGKDSFTMAEITRIKQLIIERCNAPSRRQKAIRDKMRDIGFYGRDDFGITNMTVEKFNGLIQDKKIKIAEIGSNEPLNLNETIAHPKNISQSKASLPPLIDENAKILILGTMPGEKSLQKREYYASPNNSFWKIMSSLFNENNDFVNYTEKEVCLKKHQIALWDVLSYCNRARSSDAHITNEELNDIEELLEKYPNIHKIVCNGKKASTYLSIQKGNVEITIAESTSNANAKKLEDKIENWKEKLK